MNDVKLPRQFLDSARHNPVVQSYRAHGTHDLVREAEPSSSQRGRDSHAWGNRPGNGRRKDQDVGSSLRQAVHLVPSRSADSLRSQLQREAVQHPNARVSVAHCFLLTLSAYRLRKNSAALLPWLRWTIDKPPLRREQARTPPGPAPPRFEPSPALPRRLPRKYKPARGRNSS